MSRLIARLTLRSETEAQIDFSAFIPAILDLPMRINPSRSPFERNSPDTLGNLLTHHFYHGEELTWMESVFAKPSESDF